MAEIAAAVPDERVAPMAFRVGITGTRALPALTEASGMAVRDAIAEVLRTIVDAMAQVSQTPLARAYYRPLPRPMLRCLSPLAEGADQMFASVALDQRAFAADKGIDVCLEVAIPFAAAAYKATFSPARAAELAQCYDRLADAASCGILELDGDAGSDIVRPLSYQATGEILVRNADIMIAVWDDTVAAKGRGGTRDIIHFALKSGVPVWWIDPSGRHRPRFFDDELEFWGKVSGLSPHDRLGAYLHATLVPPAVPPARHTLAGAGRVGLATFLAEPLVPNRNCWQLHAWAIGGLRRWAAVGTAASAPRQPPSPRGPLPRRILDGVRARWPFARGDGFTTRIAPRLARAYQHRYRTSYLLVVLAGAAALTFAVLGLADIMGEAAASICEFVSMIVVLLLVVVNTRRQWHQRYTSYRLLSELGRPASLLNALGWSLPFAQMQRTAGDGERNWTAWLAAAHARAMPLAAGVLGAQLPAIRERIVVDLIDTQIAFHERRRAECEGASRWLEMFGVATFAITLGLIVWKVALALGVDPFSGPFPGRSPSPDGMRRLSALTAAAPALSAISFGLKAYEEFEPLAELSGQMSTDLGEARRRIEAIDLDRPLASQALARELLAVASLMLSEVTGWAELFRSRSVNV